MWEFTIQAGNDGCAEPADEPIVFEVTINILGEETILLDQLFVTIIISPVIGES